MTFHDETFQRVSVAEAARILGVSPSTVRRLVKAGKLVGESVLRPQGSAYVVRLPRDASTVVDGLSGTSQPPRGEERSNASPAASGQPPAEAMVSLIQTTIATVLGPLVAEQAALRQTVERQAGELKEMARENGRQAAEIEALRAPHSHQGAPRHAPGLWGVLVALGVVMAVLLAAGAAAWSVMVR